MKARARQWQQLAPPAVGELWKPVQENHARPSGLLESGFQDMHHQTIVVIDQARADAAGNGKPPIQNRIVPPLRRERIGRGAPACSRTGDHVRRKGGTGKQRSRRLQETSSRHLDAIEEFTAQVALSGGGSLSGEYTCCTRMLSVTNVPGVAGDPAEGPKVSVS